MSAMKLDPSLFISDTVHERTVELGDGTKHKMHFRELTNPDLLRFTFAERSDDEDVRAESRARLVAASLCDENGKPVLPFEHAIRLKPQVLSAFFAEVLAVNGFGDDEKKG